MDGVKDLVWDGIALGNSRGMGFLLQNCTNVQVKRLRVSGFAGLGGKVDGGDNVTLSRLNVSRMGAGGIAISGGDRPTLTPCGHRLLDSEISYTDDWIFCTISRTLVGTC